MKSALRKRLAPAELHHQVAHDPSATGRAISRLPFHVVRKLGEVWDFVGQTAGLAIAPAMPQIRHSIYGN
jgi:hypothetical protein